MLPVGIEPIQGVNPKSTVLTDTAAQP